jgi:hypothetical protein
VTRPSELVLGTESSQPFRDREEVHVQRKALELLVGSTLAQASA